MVYEIKLTNKYNPNSVRTGEGIISPYPEYIPDSAVQEYISDNERSDGGFISIPTYNRVQYINIPPNSILTITTENSDEAAYYSNLELDNGSVTVNPEPIDKEGGGGGGGGGEYSEFIINIDAVSTEEIICDKTFAEIESAVTGGQTPFVNINLSHDDDGFTVSGIFNKISMKYVYIADDGSTSQYVFICPTYGDGQVGYITLAFSDTYFLLTTQWVSTTDYAEGFGQYQS